VETDGSVSPAVGNLLAELALLATVVGALVGFLSWRSETQATDREHESRRAREVRAEYKN
jgi:hypothetical protein